jgi:hypothetical protein
MTTYYAHSVLVHVDAHRQRLLAEAADERLARHARLRRRIRPRHLARTDGEW